MASDRPAVKPAGGRDYNDPAQRERREALADYKRRSDSYWERRANPAAEAHLHGGYVDPVARRELDDGSVVEFDAFEPPRHPSDRPIVRPGEVARTEPLPYRVGPTRAELEARLELEEIERGQAEAAEAGDLIERR